MIGVLSDNVLLEIFDCCRKGGDLSPFHIWEWHSLVHVCRRWRQIIFASLRCLHLQLLCTQSTPSRKILDFWPTIPIVFQCWNVFECNDEDNVIAVLEHPDRVSRIKLIIHELQLGKIATLTQKPFPVLTHLFISSHCGMGAAVPDEFLGGSAPSLQQLDVCDVLYPELQSLLLSASNLVNLSLRNIPRTGYISPEAMVSLVTFSTKLEMLHIDFSARISYPKLIISPPMSQTHCKTLTNGVATLVRGN